MGEWVWGRVEGGYSTKFYTGRLRSEVQPLTLLCTIFDRKVLPLCIPSIDEWDSFYVPSVELSIHFNYRKYE